MLLARPESLSSSVSDSSMNLALIVSLVVRSDFLGEWGMSWYLDPSITTAPLRQARDSLSISVASSQLENRGRKQNTDIGRVRSRGKDTKALVNAHAYCSTCRFTL